jgi:hypothetical protein
LHTASKILAVGFLLYTGSLAYATDQEQNISGTVPIFCRDSTQTFQPFVRTDYNKLAELFTRQFGWQHSLQ